jgi:glucose/arabinose dehydrogenase
MKINPVRFVLRLLAFAWFGVLAFGAEAQRLPTDKIKVPPGFTVSVFASGLANARSMAWGDKGTLFVGTQGAGKVYAVRHKDGKATQVFTLASGMNMPNGVAFRDGALYVAEVDRILRYDDIESRLDSPPAPVVVGDRFPTESHHGWKFIRFGPDGWLYVPVGAPCNACEPDERHGLIARIRVDAAPATGAQGPAGSGYEVFARGVRNSVGFDWQPETRELWFTDNGRDMMGDDLPSDELNHAPAKGMHFGFPYCHQGDTPDPGFTRRACSEFTPPAVKLGPHVAALGMRFYTGAQFPAEFRGNIFIAEHGSWNRSRKIGYRVARVVVQGGKAIKHEIFAEGWLQGESAWGRPADIEIMPDGSLLVSDDHAGAIYRIAYSGK